MAFLDDFLARIDSLPQELYCKYSLMRNLDKTLQAALQRKNEQRCEREIEEIRRGVESGNITPDTSHIRFSNEALDEQKRCMTIADEKVSLAQKAYNMVDAHIQELDKYLKKFDEDLRRERELTGAHVVEEQNVGGSVRSGKAGESNRGRKKSRLTTATEAPCMDLELPVDPNEPTYCFCNQVSYGEMVACDNPDCKIEWFHFGCVGLSEQPKGKWYCSDCAGTQKRRKAR
ncbi:PHD finger protein [Nymphaea thermarum]|nr:PHD finger protein [Nymphaea thermarum]